MSLERSTRRVKLAPSGRQFDCQGNQSLLEAGLSAGLALPFNCSNGSCGTCRASVKGGTLEQIAFHDYALTEAEKAQNMCLMCSYTASSDAVIEVIEASSTHDIPSQEMDAKFCHREWLLNVLLVRFKFTRGKALRFLPGQYASIILPSGQSANLPISSCPCDASYVEFHLLAEAETNTEIVNIRTAFIEELLSLKNRERVSIKGPFGDFTLSSPINSAQLFLVSGIEFASIQGLLEQIFNIELVQPSCLVWFSQNDKPNYRHNLCRAWHDAIDQFTYLPCDANTDLSQLITAQWLSEFAAGTVYIIGSGEIQLEAMRAIGFEPGKVIRVSD